jgi:uncharacterized membrane protein
VVLSWTLVNTVFTPLAHLYYTSRTAGGLRRRRGPPDYRDRVPRVHGRHVPGVGHDLSTRHTAHRAAPGIIAYIFGVVIIATTINIIAGFLRAAGRSPPPHNDRICQT